MHCNACKSGCKDCTIGFSFSRGDPYQVCLYSDNRDAEAVPAVIRAGGQSKKDKTGGTAQLQSQIQGIRSAFPGNIAVYMKNLKSVEEIAIDGDTTTKRSILYTISRG